jgi:hypothetical protein
MRAFVALLVAIPLGIIVAGCESTRIQGTYVNASGTIVLELKPGGAARFTNQTRSEECKYSVEANTIPMSCPADERTFAIAEDGSLTTPSIAGALKKMP